jgi:hypothetical protein
MQGGTKNVLNILYGKPQDRKQSGGPRNRWILNRVSRFKWFGIGSTVGSHDDQVL